LDCASETAHPYLWACVNVGAARDMFDADCN
jgi:hypothetical protein